MSILTSILNKIRPTKVFKPIGPAICVKCRYSNFGFNRASFERETMRCYKDAKKEIVDSITGEIQVVGAVPCISKNATGHCKDFATDTEPTELSTPENPFCASCIHQVINDGAVDCTMSHFIEDLFPVTFGAGCPRYEATRAIRGPYRLKTTAEYVRERK